MECVINDGDNKTRKIDRILEKSDMEKFIGRYTMHYGPPLDYSSGKENIMVYEFCNFNRGVERIALLKFWRVFESTAPVEEEKQPEQVQKFLDVGALTEVNKWGY